MTKITRVSPNYCSNKLDPDPGKRGGRLDLIPTYRRGNGSRRTVESALATGAGEVIVSDDASHDGSIEQLESICDPRLRVIVQPRRLGLWPNHRAALLLATRPWIKFLQDDDRLAPDALRRMLAHMDLRRQSSAGCRLSRTGPRGSDSPPFGSPSPCVGMRASICPGS